MGLAQCSNGVMDPHMSQRISQSGNVLTVEFWDASKDCGATGTTSPTYTNVATVTDTPDGSCLTNEAELWSQSHWQGDEEYPGSGWSTKFTALTKIPDGSYILDDPLAPPS